MNKIKITLLVTFLAILSCENTNKKTTTATQGETSNTVIKEDSNELIIEFPNLNTYSNPSELKENVEKVVTQINKSSFIKKQIFITLHEIPNTPLTIWYDNNTPIKIEYGAATDAGEITAAFNHYLKDGDLWYADEKYANYLFQDGKLKYWLNEKWEENEIPETDFNNREEYFNTQVKQFIAKLKGETIFFDEQKREWRDNTGKCHTCTLENGFNPYGWLLNDKEMTLVPQVLEAEKKYGVDLKRNRISSKEILENLIAEIAVESSEQDQKFKNIDITELNEKLTLQEKEVTAREVMKLYYPHTVDKNAEGNENVSISDPSTNKGYTFVTLIHNNLLDDSVKAEKYEMTLIKKDNKWEVISLKKNWACWEGRGHGNWGIQLCE